MRHYFEPEHSANLRWQISLPLLLRHFWIVGWLVGVDPTVLSCTSTPPPWIQLSPIKAMKHQPTRLNCRVGLEGVGVSVIGLHLNLSLRPSLITDRLVGSRPPYDSTVELGWMMCHCLNSVWRPGWVNLW